MFKKISSRLPIYVQLTRLNRPIGTYLVLWPTLWALLLAGQGQPSIANLLIFSVGCLLMRSAGCVINDYADRNIDGHVERTNQRPLASGEASEKEALILFALLGLVSFALVLLTNPLTIWLSTAGIALAIIYPYMKRHTHLPQVVLGAAFSWSIPMAFSAELNDLPGKLWGVFAAALVLAVIYDTFYAMVDREDDLKIGVKSTAILFGELDLKIVAVLQLIFLILMVLNGRWFDLGGWYYCGLAIAGGLFIYQQWISRDRDRDACFRAFLNSHYVGLVICVFLAADFWLGQ
ncbi:MAG: 4-hydroxybenzoate octaprenyltransferase [Pseudomonadales bacterium]